MSTGKKRIVLQVLGDFRFIGPVEVDTSVKAVTAFRKTFVHLGRWYDSLTQLFEETIAVDVTEEFWKNLPPVAPPKALSKHMRPPTWEKELMAGDKPGDGE